MTQFNFRQSAVILLDLFLLGACLFHIPEILDRARVPFSTTAVDSRVIVEEVFDQFAASDLRTGDVVVTCSGVPILEPESLELLADRGEIGSEVQLDLERGGVVEKVTIRLVPFYDSPRFALVMAFVGIAIWGMGVLIAWHRLDTLSAHLLHLSLVALGLCVLLTQGRIDPDHWISAGYRIGLFATYMAAAVGFFLFSRSYPPSHKAFPLVMAASVVVVAIVVVVGTSASFLASITDSSAATDGRFHWWYDLFHAYQAVLAFGMFGSIIVRYVRSTTNEDRARLQWILWGLAVGPLPFLLTITIPNIVLSRDLVPEEFATIVLLVTPFSLAVSFLRHQLFDVEILISRTIVYVLLSFFVGALYIIGVFLVTSSLGMGLPFESHVAIVFIAVVVAFAFNPLRRRLQRVIDSTLFPLRSDYRSSLRHATHALHGALSLDDLCRILRDEIAKVLPIRSTAVYIVDGVHAHRTSADDNSFPETIPLEWSEQLSSLPPALLQFSLARILTTESGKRVGICVARMQAVTERLSKDEDEFFQTICAEASEMFERLELQREVMFETEERRRLEEISKLKSFFVSSVSHELRTPLTSIRLFAELLKSGNVRSRKRQDEYLEIIDHEAERLTRMIDSVLNFSRIERGVKEYRFGMIDPALAVRRAVSAMEYPFRLASGKIIVRVPRSMRKIWADEDAVQEATINLLSNALKYSPGKKEAVVTCRKTKGTLRLQVKDCGMGISEEQLLKVFDQFYRVRDNRAAQAGGMGLGLSLVKHIAEAHGGTVEVSSRLGKGSMFTIIIPLRNEEEVLS